MNTKHKYIGVFLLFLSLLGFIAGKLLPTMLVVSSSPILWNVFIYGTSTVLSITGLLFLEDSQEEKIMSKYVGLKIFMGCVLVSVIMIWLYVFGLAGVVYLSAFLKDDIIDTLVILLSFSEALLFGCIMLFIMTYQSYVMDKAWIERKLRSGETFNETLYRFCENSDLNDVDAYFSLSKEHGDDAANRWMQSVARRR